MNNRLLKQLQNMKMNKKSLGAVALTAGIIGTTLIPQTHMRMVLLKNLAVDLLYVVQLMVH